MRPATVIIMLPVISVYTLAFSWGRHDSSKSILDENTAAQDLAIPDFEFDKDAIGTVDGPYMRKPDCFRRAAGRIRVKCAEIDIDPDQRVKAAISMTLCELRTAEFHSIPLECEAFLEEGRLGDRAHHGICVEALSRSTQSWASYSGYLREIPQLCFAYQRSNEKYLALEIYRNATVEKIAYIRHLRQWAEKEDEARAVWQSLLVDLKNSIDNLQASPTLSHQIYTDISASVLHELQQVMHTQKEAFDVQLQINRGHSLALSDHSRTLMSLLTEFEQSFSARLNSGLQLLDNRLGDSLDTSNKLWHQVSVVEGGLFSATNLIAQLALSVGHLSDALNSSAHEVKLMNIAQSNAVQAADGLVAALKQMNETAMSALLDINATAIRVSQAIGVGSFFSNFLSLAGAIFLYLKQFSVLRLIASTVVVQHSPSFIATPCLVAILSMVRWSLKRILTRQGFRYPPPCVCSFKATSLESNQTSVAHLSPVTLTARATPWVRRSTFGWRSSQFSRIPDRLCGRRLDE